MQRAIAVLIAAALFGWTGSAASGADRIGVRVVDGEGKFYNTVTGEPFVPRGVNYVDFVRVNGMFYEDRVFATNQFRPERIRREFERLAALGYNTVRIFFDHCGTYGPECLTVQGRAGLNPRYLDNIAQTTRIAEETGIYLLLTSNDIPDWGGYGELANRDAGPMMEGYRNTHFIAPSGLEAASLYWTDIMAALADRDTAWPAVLGWSLVNEQWIFKKQPPWSLDAGEIVNNTGASYDLSVPDEKRAMVSDAVANYGATLRDIIRETDPQALVGMGFFAPQFPNDTFIGGDWWVDTEPLLADGRLDFYDFHAYYDTDLTVARQAENFGMPGYPEHPVIMGEVAAGQALVLSAATSLRLEQEWYAASCDAGFDGWLHWGYFPFPISDPPWTLLDANGLLLEGLAPVNRPDPCDAEAFSPVGNVAYRAQTRASSALPAEPTRNAVDGTGAQWGSGRDAPAWLDIDLPQPVTLNSVLLWVAQWPEGATHHRVWADLEDSRRVLVAEFEGITREDDRLRADLPAPLGSVTSVRVETVSSVSWVAWREVELGGTLAEPAACVAFARTAVNLRPDASTANAPVGRLAAGEGIVASAATPTGDGFTWLALVNGTWVRADVVETSPTCESLPPATPPG